MSNGSPKSGSKKPWPTELRLHKDRRTLTIAFDTGEAFEWLTALDQHTGGGTAAARHHHRRGYRKAHRAWARDDEYGNCGDNCVCRASQ